MDTNLGAFIILGLTSMSWLPFAFSGPVLWAVSTHLDKYLVEKYFKNSNVAVLLIFTALIGLLTLPLGSSHRKWPISAPGVRLSWHSPACSI
jgi:hypothetical protein